MIIDLIGKQFISQRHACPVVWIVKYYHRCDGWVCEEQEHKTTCEFSTQEILDGEINPKLEWTEEDEKAWQENRDYREQQR